MKTYTHGTDTYMFYVSAPGNCLYVRKNGIEKRARIIDDSSFCYKLQKTQIKAEGGATGLYNCLVRWIDEDFCTCFVRKILNWIIDNMK